MNSEKPPRPIGIRAPHGSNFFEISWENGRTHKLENEILRGYCPCAGCQGHSGVISFQEGRNHEIRDIKPVGNYALSLVWGDQHDSGIYSFEYLYRLGTLYDQLGAAGLIEMQTIDRARTVAAAQTHSNGNEPLERP